MKLVVGTFTVHQYRLLVLHDAAGIDSQASGICDESTQRDSKSNHGILNSTSCS